MRGERGGKKFLSRATHTIKNRCQLCSETLLGPKFSPWNPKLRQPGNGSKPTLIQIIWAGGISDQLHSSAGFTAETGFRLLSAVSFPV